jgi:hypothetical protein
MINKENIAIIKQKLKGEKQYLFSILPSSTIAFPLVELRLSIRSIKTKTNK